MRKRSDEVFDNMDRESRKVEKIIEVQSSGLNLEANYLRNRLKSLERTRHQVCWDNRSTIAGINYNQCDI